MDTDFVVGPNRELYGMASLILKITCLVTCLAIAYSAKCFKCFGKRCMEGECTGDWCVNVHQVTLTDNPGAQKSSAYTSHCVGVADTPPKNDSCLREIGKTTCYCSTDYCNGGNYITTSKLVSLIAVFVAFSNKL